MAWQLFIKKVGKSHDRPTLLRVNFKGMNLLYVLSKILLL